MTDPTPPTDPTPADPYAPALTPGRAALDYAPAFDPADVAAKMPPRPTTGTYHEPGEFREPAAPIAPPAFSDVPEDLAAALAEYDAKRAAWGAAVDAVDDYRDDARQSRARREAAIRAAGQAAARGAKRPAIPTAISEAEEETEARILATVVDVRRREADAAARAADRLTMGYAAQWAAESVARFGPALAEATEKTQAAYEAAQHAEGVLTQSAYWRSLALAVDLEARGVRVGEHQRGRIMSDLLDAVKTDRYAQAEAQHRAPAELLNQVHAALGVLRQCDPGAVVHPDALSLPGDVATWREAWWHHHDTAPTESREAYKGRRLRAYPPRS